MSNRGLVENSYDAVPCFHAPMLSRYIDIKEILILREYYKGKFRIKVVVFRYFLWKYWDMAESVQYVSTITNMAAPDTHSLQQWKYRFIEIYFLYKKIIFFLSIVDASIMINQFLFQNNPGKRKQTPCFKNFQTVLVKTPMETMKN